MTFEEEMERFWKKQSAEDRKIMEGDAEYGSAVKAKNSIKAQELACEMIYGVEEIRALIVSRQRRSKQESNSI